jgi:hypothetical protein
MKPDMDFGFFSCEEAIQLAYGTSAVLLRCLFVPEIMHRRALDVFSTSKAGKLPYDLYCVWCHVKLNNKKNCITFMNHVIENNHYTLIDQSTDCLASC